MATQANLATDSESRLRSLRRDLRETRDLKALERAVREAETLEDAGRLPPDMADLLHTARATFDDMRIVQCEMIALARFGDLAARKKLVEHITRQIVNEGAQTIWDAGRSEFIPIGRALDEAQRFYVEESEKVARHELGIIDARLPAYPDAALKHLREVMARRDLQEGESGEQYVRHFAPDTVSQKLKPREGELEKMVDALRRAEAKVVDAAAAEDDLVALGLLLEARAIYPGMVDLEVTLEQARNSAIHRLSLLIEGFHNEARAFLDEEQFDEAVKAVNKADAVPQRWPEGTLPEALQKLKDKGSTLRDDIQSARLLRAGFDKAANRIRADILMAIESQRQAIALYNWVMTDDRFARLSAHREELRAFVNVHLKLIEQAAPAPRRD